MFFKNNSVQGLGEPAQNLDSLDSVVESLHEIPESDLESNLPPLISVNVLEAADETETKKEEVEQPKETVPTLDMQNVEPQSDAPASAQPSTHNTSEWYFFFQITRDIFRYNFETDLKF